MIKTKLPYTLTFLSGLLLGWLALGWWLWPVAYVGEAYTYELNQADKLAYTSAVVDSFALTGQANPAWFSGWYTDEVRQALEQVAQANPAKANWARALANQVSASVPQPVQVKAQNQASESGVLDWLPYLALAVVVVGLVGGGLWIAHNAAQAKSNSSDFEWVPNPRILPTVPGEFQGLRQAVRAASQLAYARLDFGPNEPTDQHFLIESQQEGEPSLGEFGVNQVEDFMAWDVWLFDQKAMVTVTKVLADKTSEEISSRGEVVGWTDPIVLETPNLKMVGSVENSFVDELHHSNGIFTIELAVEAKDAE